MLLKTQLFRMNWRLVLLGILGVSPVLLTPVFFQLSLITSLQVMGEPTYGFFHDYGYGLVFALWFFIGAPLYLKITYQKAKEIWTLNHSF